MRVYNLRRDLWKLEVRPSDKGNARTRKGYKPPFEVCHETTCTDTLPCPVCRPEHQEKEGVPREARAGHTPFLV